jgi:excisionase family DNA binding protein
METNTPAPVRINFTTDSTYKPLPGLLTVHQTCCRLNCAKSRVYLWFLSGDLPRVKVGGRTMVPTAAVDALLNSFVAAAEADAAARRAGVKA